jgi:hypothetical protein
MLKHNIILWRDGIILWWCFRRLAVFQAFWSLTLAISIASGQAAGAATTERIVTDRHTGLAIFGFDPVAYFVDARPVPGKPEFELRVEQAIWHFHNEGNRAAFAQRPDIYMPRYGGYDPIALARGVARPGNPAVWRIEGERLYLFYDEQGRDDFDSDPGKVISAADERWPGVMQGLTP